MNVKHYPRPSSLEEALELKDASPASRFLAGGMELMVPMGAVLSRPQTPLWPPLNQRVKSVVQQRRSHIFRII